VTYFGTLYLTNQAELAYDYIDKLVDLMSLYDFSNYSSHRIDLDYNLRGDEIALSVIVPITESVFWFQKPSAVADRTQGRAAAWPSCFGFAPTARARWRAQAAGTLLLSSTSPVSRLTLPSSACKQGEHTAIVPPRAPPRTAPEPSHHFQIASAKSTTSPCATC
jgi:hypothetical protein